MSAAVTRRQAGIGAAVVSVIALALMAGVLAGTGGISGGQAAVGSAPRTKSAGGGRCWRTLTAGRCTTSRRTARARRRAMATVLYWTPVAGPLTAGPGVTGKLGTIRRNGGKLQETCNGRSLYTYVGDNGPAQTNGNNINLDGCYRYDLPVSG